MALLLHHQQLDKDQPQLVLVLFGSIGHNLKRHKAHCQLSGLLWKGALTDVMKPPSGQFASQCLSISLGCEVGGVSCPTACCLRQLEPLVHPLGLRW